jgi:hypothetical protein
MCKVNRDFGVELEGYTSSNCINDTVEGWEGVEDGSLDNDSNECDYCDSDGEIYRTCDTCDGDGHITEECPECDKGLVECSSCDGTGVYDDDGEEFDCDNCGGDGKVDCYDCDGDGDIQEECGSCGGGGERYYQCGECGGSHYNREGGKNGVEFVSPRLSNMDTFEEVFDHIHHYDWETDETCGTHIHVNGDDFTPNDVRKLVYLMSAIEPVFYGLVSGNRYNYRYCKILDHTVATDIIEKNNIDWNDLARAVYRENRHRGSFSKYESERYFAFNLHSWFYRGSFEFRYFDGCDDIDELKRYVELCTKVVDFCKNATMEQLKPIVDKIYSCYNSDAISALLVIGEVIGLEYNIELSIVSNYNKYINEDLISKHDLTGVVDLGIAI